MENKTSSTRRAFLPIALFFILINTITIGLKARFQEWGMDTSVLQGGNILLFLISIITFYMYKRGMETSSTQMFLRNVYGSMMLKLFGCVIAAFVYIYIARDQVNKPALFACMGLYLVYTALELRVVLKQPKA
ncbi:hypothetical protein KJS94_02395 [Flavihumibacter rivuli]|uniref:hypothetical protein n=1 Tax=Flavihumibacter rivuli TaxID=2838156 RepID=UPI001BDE23AF|nr:hypothetical protein [Flavihumibacter rivuli]ULQ57046.1 hypothetical protein KJS94_02395 [Flavihumibacter rivuli]